ncbi:tetratricopeptide repeat protein [Singulisphaera rosea]
MKVRTIGFFAILLAMTSLVGADEFDQWVGRRVFTPYAKDRAIAHVYRVDKTQGERLWLVSETTGNGRWARAKYVVPYEEAIEFYSRAIQSRPQPNYYISRGMAWIDQGRTDLAITDYDGAIDLDPEDPRIYLLRAYARISRKELETAIADLDEAIRLEPESSTAYNTRGQVRYSLEQYGKAIPDYLEAIRLDPTDPAKHNGPAWLWATCPDPEFRNGKKAVESALRACELSGWKEAAFLDTLAAAYAEASDFTKAAEWQGKALELCAFQLQPSFKERLNLYLEKKPYRESE